MSNTALLLMTLLQFKHFFADYSLQSRLRGHDTSKLKFFSRHNYIHCRDHALCSMAVTICFADIWLVLALAVAEFAAHYFIDFAKTQIRYHLMIHPNQRAFWHLNAVDQALHTLCYAVMVLVIT